VRIGADEQVGSVAPFFRSIDDRRKRPEAEIGGPKKRAAGTGHTCRRSVCMLCVSVCVCMKVEAQPKNSPQTHNSRRKSP
jgi:hypothetical protein